MVRGVGSRGNELLLAHCELLDADEHERAGSYERLASAIGAELARLLVYALSDDPGRRTPGHEAARS